MFIINAIKTQKANTILCWSHQEGSIKEMGHSWVLQDWWGVALSVMCDFQMMRQAESNESLRKSVALVYSLISPSRGSPLIVFSVKIPLPHIFNNFDFASSRNLDLWSFCLDLWSFCILDIFFPDFYLLFFSLNYKKRWSSIMAVLIILWCKYKENKNHHTL